MRMGMLDKVWPAGTMVVTRTPVSPNDGGHTRPKGACGTILTPPEHPEGNYLIRFMDGAEFYVEGTRLDILKHYQEGEIGNFEHALTGYDLHQHVIYRCVVGSRAYGLDHDASDLDRRGFYLPPADLQWSLYGVPEQLEQPGVEECYWEFAKFIQLALKANPNVLECLYSPLVEHVEPIGQRVIDLRHIFLSKMIYQTYNRYVMSQFKTMSRKLESGQHIKQKHAMHLIRLLLNGIAILNDGFVPVNVTEHRDQLLAIRDGLLSWQEINAWRDQLHAEFDRAFELSSLPERPDYSAANALLITARRWAAGLET
jgi:predicted nucleotidyltransferase